MRKKKRRRKRRNSKWKAVKNKAVNKAEEMRKKWKIRAKLMWEGNE
jgi:hypothetical protein